MRRSLPLVAALALSVFCTACAADRKDVTNDQLPAPVQATLEHEAQGGKVNKITREKKESGTTYQADVSATNGQKWDVVIDGNGKLVYKHLQK